jgi:3-oxoacyl-[acyl-carrier-protein] synthase II
MRRWEANDGGADGGRIAVTGIGIVSPIGGSVEEVVTRLRAGVGAIEPIRSFDTTGLDFQHAAEIGEPLPRELDGVPLDRTAALGVVAAERAVADATLDHAVWDETRVALVVGICAGGSKDRSGPAAVGAGRPAEAAEGFLAASHFAQTAAIARRLSVHGASLTISTACASSGSALAHGWDLLRQNRADVVLAGGADAFSFFTYAGFHALGAMAPAPASPFSVGLGVSFGEGAGFVVIERLPAARSRGAKIYGLLLGYGVTADAYHMTSPDPSGEGLSHAMASAVESAGVPLERVDYVNAHGTGTRDNDLAETLAIKRLFGEGRSIPPVSSTKSFFGHTLGAAGVLEFIVSLLAQQQGFIPPTINYQGARPGCDLDYVPNQARSGRVRVFLSNSAAFGGVNVALA